IAIIHLNLTCNKPVSNTVVMLAEVDIPILNYRRLFAAFDLVPHSRTHGKKMLFVLLKNMTSTYTTPLGALIVIVSSPFTNRIKGFFKAVEYLVAQGCKNAGVGNVHRPHHMSLILGFITPCGHHRRAVMIGKIQK